MKAHRQPSAQFQISWEERFELARFGVGDVAEHIVEPLVRVDVVHFARGEESVHHGRILGGTVRTREQIILAANATGRGVFHQVVVDVDMGVFGVGHQLAPLILSVSYGLARQVIDVFTHPEMGQQPGEDQKIKILSDTKKNILIPNNIIVDIANDKQR